MIQFFRLKFCQKILDEFEIKPGTSLGDANWKINSEMRSQALFLATGFRDLLISFQKDVEKKSEKRRK